MRLRPIVLFAIVLGLVVLVPVLTVIGLGFYGTSIGGQSSGVAASGAELRVVPAGGPPGVTVTVSGRHWEPRSEIAIYLGIPGGDTADERRIRLLAVTASRGGTFEIEIVIPSLVFTTAASRVDIEAEPVTDGPVPDPVRAAFAVQGYDTTLNVHVVDSRRGINLPGAHLELSDRFGRPIATATAGLDGIATFVGARPGPAQLDISLIDFRRRQADITLPEAGNYDFQVDLAPLPSRRLLAPHPDSLAGGLLMYALIDRASGLALDSIASVRLRGVPLQSVGNPGLEYRFVLPAEIRVSLEGDAGSAQPPRALTSVLAVVNGLKGFSEGSPSHIYYVGNTGVIDLVFTIDDPYWATQSLYLVDNRNFRILQRIRLGPEVLPPALSRDGSRVYALNWFSRRLDIFSAATGTRGGRVTDLPPFISAVTADPDADALYLLANLTGSIYHLNMAGDRVAVEIANVPGATAIAADPVRRRLYLFGEGLKILTVIDLDSDAGAEFFPLEAPIEWLWIDPDGDFLFGGLHGDTSIQIIDAATLMPVTTTRLPPMRVSRRAGN